MEQSEIKGFPGTWSIQGHSWGSLAVWLGQESVKMVDILEAILSAA